MHSSSAGQQLACIQQIERGKKSALGMRNQVSVCFEDGQEYIYTIYIMQSQSTLHIYIYMCVCVCSVD